MQAMRAFEKDDSEEARDTLLMFGGAALMILGAGMILMSPGVRKYLGGFSPGGLFQAAVPDLERYLRLRAM